MKAKRKYIPREIWDVAGSPDLAKERIHLNEAVKKDPSNYEPLYFLGFNYLEARMLNESAETFEKVLKLKPDHPLALENLALAYFQNHRYDKALAVSERGLKLYPQNPRLIYLLGQCYLSGENNPGKAEKLYTEAISKGIKSPHIYTGLAEVYIENKGDKKDQAYKILDKCIDEFPGYPNASALLSELCMERGDAEKAVSLLKKVIEITPAFTDARRLLGEIYIETADYKSAEETLKIALNQRPDNINEIKNRLGEVYVNTGQTEKAREMLNQVINFRGEDPDGSENLAQAYLMLALADLTEGKTSSAQQNIKKAEKEEHEPAALTIAQSRLLTQQGEYDKAASLLQNLSQQTDEANSIPTYRIYLEMAKIEAYRGNKPKAAAHLITASNKAAGYQKTTLKTLISRDEKLNNIK
jgi:tetratricopeptide (TPR) repeat protein